MHLNPLRLIFYYHQILLLKTNSMLSGAEQVADLLIVNLEKTHLNTEPSRKSSSSLQQSKNLELELKLTLIQQRPLADILF